MKKTLFNIGKIVILLSLLPLWFAKIFVDVGHFPSKTNPGAIEKAYFYHSMYDNITTMEYDILLYISFTFIAFSVIAAALAIKYKNSRRIQMISHIIFTVTVVMFLLFYLLASTVARGY